MAYPDHPYDPPSEIYELLAKFSPYGAPAIPALGTIFLGPAGGVAGLGVQAAFTFICKEYQERQLSTLQKQRIGNNLHYLFHKLNEELGKGRTFRGDGTFRFPSNGIPLGSDIIEALISLVSNEIDNDKSMAICNVLVHFLLDDTITKENGLQIFYLVSSLSKNQLLVISLYYYLEKKNLVVIEIGTDTYILKNITPYNRDDINTNLPLNLFLIEFDYLFDINILQLQGQFGSSKSNPIDARLTGYGKKIAEMIDPPIPDTKNFKHFINFIADKVEKTPNF